MNSDGPGRAATSAVLIVEGEVSEEQRQLLIGTLLNAVCALNLRIESQDRVAFGLIDCAYHRMERIERAYVPAAASVMQAAE